MTVGPKMTVESAAAQSSAKLATVNGLRGLAILGVLWHHTVYKLWLSDDVKGTGSVIDHLASAMLNSGWLGVNLFFVLSGFVLYLPFADGRRQRSGGDVWRAFLVRRAFRLLPLFYLSLLAFIAVDFARGRLSISAGEAVLYLTATFGFVTDTFLPEPNWVLWSLGVEIWFSLAFPFVVYAIDRYGLSRVLIAVLVFSLSIRVIGASSAFMGPGDRLNPIKDGILGRLDDFLVGIWICNAYVSGQLNRPWAAKLAGAGVLLGVLGCLGWEAVLGGSLAPAWIPLLHNGIQAGSAGLLAIALIGGASVRRALSWRPLQLLGMMCFSVYVWHGRPIEWILSSDFSILSGFAYVSCVGTLSVITYRFVEFGREKDWRSLFLLRPAAGGDSGGATRRPRVAG